MFIFDAIEKRDLGSAFFQAVKSAWLCDEGSFALELPDGSALLCLIDWEYKDVQSV